jgi:hypothetical protein
MMVIYQLVVNPITIALSSFLGQNGATFASTFEGVLYSNLAINIVL